MFVDWRKLWRNMTRGSEIEIPGGALPKAIKEPPDPSATTNQMRTSSCNWFQLSWATIMLHTSRSVFEVSNYEWMERGWRWRRPPPKLRKLENNMCSRHPNAASSFTQAHDSEWIFHPDLIDFRWRRSIIHKKIINYFRATGGPRVRRWGGPATKTWRVEIRCACAREGPSCFMEYLCVCAPGRSMP